MVAVQGANRRAGALRSYTDLYQYNNDVSGEGRDKRGHGHQELPIGGNIVPIPKLELVGD